MNRRIAIGLVMLVALMVAATAYADDGLLLRYKYQAGKADTYAVKGAMQGTMVGGPSPMPLTVNVDMRMTIKTTAVNDQGVASQEMAIDRMAVTTETMGMQMQMLLEGGKLSMLVDGKPMELPANVPGLPDLGQTFKAKVDARGRVLELDLGSMGDMVGGFDPAALQQTTVFPEGPVAPGATWSQEIKLPLKIMGQKMEVVMKYDYTFVGVEQYKGKDVARINFKGSGQTRVEGAATPFSMSQTFTGYELFDYGAGASPSAKIHLQQSMAGAVSEGQPAPAMDMAGDFEVNLQ